MRKEFIFLNERNFSKLKTEIDKSRLKNPGFKIVFSSDSDELNRKVLEKAKIDILLISLFKRKDFSKQRNSGLNSILTNIAKKNKVEIGIDLEEAFIDDKKRKAEILARIIQNIKLCKKKKIQMKFILKNKQIEKNILKSLGLTLGMPTWMTKNL